MKPTYSNTLPAAIRQHFGLSQLELARFLGITRGQVAHVEAGRSVFSAPVQRRLRALASLLPPPWGPAPPPEPAAPSVAAAPDLAPLQARHRRCLHLARQVRFELETLHARHQARQHREQALRTLQAALLPGAASLLSADPAFDPAATARWLGRLAADTAATPPPGPSARKLLEARLAGLEHEAALLSQLLETGGSMGE